MATKITGLTSLGSAPADSDVIPIVDVSDTSQAASGTAKKVTAVYLVRTDGSAVNLTGGGTIALGGYTLTVAATGTASLVGHDHPASEIVSGTLDDARIAESNVTQHEAALTIAESQISDLGTYLESVAINDVSDVTIDTPADNEVLAYDSGTSTWINQTPAEAGLAEATHNQAASTITSGTFDDARIAESNVTQHEAALTITESQISDLGTYEDALGNPGTSGYVLSSLTDGTRSWIAPGATETRYAWTATTSSASTSYTSSGRFYFKSDMVPTGKSVYFGVLINNPHASETTYAQLIAYGGAAVTGSEVSNSANSLAYKESGAITLTDGTIYEAQIKLTAGTYGSGNISNCVLVFK